MKKKLNHPPDDPMQYKELFDVVSRQIEVEIVMAKHKVHEVSGRPVKGTLVSAVNQLEQLFCYTFKRNKDNGK